MKAVKVTTENPELADRFNRVLGHTVEALEESGLRYVFIGGIASGGLGRPRSTHDIDVFVRPEDAELAPRALAKHGFRTEKTDPVWLYKAFKENILVDVIFKSKGEIYFDTEMYSRVITAEFHGKELKLVSPEDLVIIKALAHSEVTPGHWHDALALLSHANLDWDYLLRRAKRAPRRVLSLFLYAQSSDIWVPKSAIDQLYSVIFGDLPVGSQSAGMAAMTGQPARPAQSPSTAPTMKSGNLPQPSPVGPTPAGPAPTVQPSTGTPAGMTPVLRMVNNPRSENYGIAKLRERLAEDPRTNELDIQLEMSEERLLLRGEVITSERREAVEQIARETFPKCHVENQIRVTDYAEPPAEEEIV